MGFQIFSAKTKAGRSTRLLRLTIAGKLCSLINGAARHHRVCKPMIDLKKHIREVPDFPKPGILFYDIGSLINHGPAWRETIERLTDIVRGEKPDILIAIESRGFLVAAPIAAALGIGFVMMRKKNKLPGKTISYSYKLEYGEDTIQMQEGMLKAGQRAVVVDDLLATGGTAAAVITLARKMGAEIARAVFIIELNFLEGRKKLDTPVSSLVAYDS
jgi:adenine phosphoribosyltransferase